MSYTKTAETTYLASNGIEYYGWVGRHILDSDDFYTSKSNSEEDFPDEEHPLEYNKKKIFQEKYCYGCEKHKDITSFPFLSYKTTKRSNLCRDCHNYALYGEAEANRMKRDRLNLKKKLKNDPALKLVYRLRNRISFAIKNKKKNTLDLLGCTPEYAYNYLVAKFTPDMTEEAFMNGDIHIDHIKPVSSFDLTNEDELQKCFHYTNIQPLWAKDNFSKGNKYSS